MNELSSHNIGAGKGDKDRSPGWRKNYDEIDWERIQIIPEEGFERIGPGRLRKRYGTRPSPGLAVENWEDGKIESYYTPPAMPTVPSDEHYEAGQHCCGGHCEKHD